VSSSDAKYPYTFFAFMAVSIMPLLFALYMILWITSFVDTGYLANENEAKQIYSKVVNYSMLAILVAMPICGFVADKLSSKIMVPISFLCRGVIAAFFVYFIDVPDSHWAIFACVAMFICTMIENVSL
jgi:MFS family permease